MRQGLHTSSCTDYTREVSDNPTAPTGAYVYALTVANAWLF